MLYQHFKGGLYLKLAEVHDCDDPWKKVVVYFSLYNFKLFARPKSSWDSMVEIAGNERVPRFHRIRSIRELPFALKQFRAYKRSTPHARVS